MPSPSATYWNTFCGPREYPETFCMRSKPAHLPRVDLETSSGHPSESRSDPEPARTEERRPSLRRTPSNSSSSSRDSVATILVEPPPGDDDFIDWLLLPEISLYQVLGVPRNATESEIRKAYLRRSKYCHPDRRSGCQGTPTRAGSGAGVSQGIGGSSVSDGTGSLSDFKRRNSANSDCTVDTRSDVWVEVSDGTQRRSPDAGRDRSAKATAAFQRLAFAYETLRDDNMRHRYDLFGDEAFAASAEFDDDGFEYWWWGDWKHDTPYDGSAEKVFGAAARQLYEEFFASSFDQIMAAIDIVHSLNPHLDFSRERLAAFFIHLRDLASGELSSGLFGSTATEVLRLTELKDEWASLSWWDISSQLRVGIEMGRLLVKIYGSILASARMQGIIVEPVTPVSSPSPPPPTASSVLAIAPAEVHVNLTTTNVHNVFVVKVL